MEFPSNSGNRDKNERSAYVEARMPNGAFLRRYETVASTNDIARDWAHSGAAHGSSVVASQQTQGRGRRGRNWKSPPNCGLLISTIVRPSEIASWSSGQLTIAIAVAIARAVEIVSPVPVQLKWPNDVLMNGRKIGGVLCESEWRSGALDFVIVGLGLNVLHTAEQLPPRPIFPASSLLLEMPASISVSQVETVYLQVLADVCEMLGCGDWNAIREAWTERCYGLNEVVRVREENAAFYGVLRGLAHDGALIVATSEGEKRVIAGEIVWE